MNKTNVIINQQWVEAPQQPVSNLPVPASRSLPVRQPVREQKPQSQPQRRVLDTKRLHTLANRQLVYLLNDHMARMKVEETYGRIALVSFVPMQAPDPTIPVPLLPLEPYGRHNRAWRGLANLLIQVERTWWSTINTSRWLKKARRNVQIIADESKGFLSYDEWVYYVDQLHECVANPKRKQW